MSYTLNNYLEKSRFDGFLYTDNKYLLLYRLTTAYTSGAYMISTEITKTFSVCASSMRKIAGGYSMCKAYVYMMSYIHSYRFSRQIKKIWLCNIKGELKC